MVNVLISTKDVNFTKCIKNMLANDKDYVFQTTSTGLDTIDIYNKINPDILVLDDNIQDLPIENIIDRISITHDEASKCNIILNLEPNLRLKLNNVEKISMIIYKPVKMYNLIESIKSVAKTNNTPTLSDYDVDWLLLSLGFNTMSSGFKYMRDTIIYSYYNPDQLEFLKNVLDKIAYKYHIPTTRVRDSLNSYVKSFNRNYINCDSKELKILLYNNGYNLSLKDFIEILVFYLIREKRNG